MAAIVQTATEINPKFPPTGSTFGLSQERGTLSLDAARAGASSPPNTSASEYRKRNMSFSIGTFTPANGLQHGMSYATSNAQAMQPHLYAPKGQPTSASIYTAVYSGVSVYEMVINKIAVMRRRSDSWLNATQILKVAGVDKGKRTKVLEKEILSGEHEKVQGGYGRYQGTWINYKRGRDFCRAYGVEDLLRPLLEYDMGQDGAQPGKGSSIETPTKEQAMAAQRKKIMYNGVEGRATLQTPNTTFFQNISPIAANAVNAINKARFDTPSPRPGSGTKRSASAGKSSQAINSQEAQYPGGSQQSMQSDGSLGMETFNGSHATPYFVNTRRSESNLDQEPPRKRARPSSSADPFAHANGYYNKSMRESSPTEPNESFMYNGFIHPGLDNGVVGLQPLPTPASNAALEKQNILASLFLDPTRDDLDDVPGIDTLSEEDFDIPIDNGAHTALHWAASLAKPSLLKALIARGASIYRVNGGGETALMRAARTTNNLDQSSFPELLELLGSTIEMRDNRGQTVLHHIAVTSAIKGRSSACRYYLDSLLEFVVRQGSASNSQQESFNRDLSQNKHKPIGLARFMSEIVNAQDIAGDTALNLAARINNRSIIQQLLEVGANPSIPNRGGLKPLDFGVGGDVGPADLPTSSQNSLSNSQKTTSENRVGDSSKQLLESLRTLVNDTELSFRSELQAKQSLIDQAQSKLRELTTALTNERRNLSDLEAKANERATLKNQIANLRRMNADKRARLSSTGPVPTEDVAVGDADTGLTVAIASMRPRSASGTISASARTPDQDAYLKSLPPSHVLEARVRAYKAHNGSLETRKMELKTKSSVLEKKLRRVVALSTGVEEEKVDENAERLAAAVKSEEGKEVDTGRLREFLRRLDEGGE
ncbi:MAG: hypothetical protein LQ340_002516 [Diploschistes diacapsis]|nr:MAG: hypothetical protein LQ340_002516 [Diploschistes diacapsis]